MEVHKALLGFEDEIGELFARERPPNFAVSLLTFFHMREVAFLQFVERQPSATVYQEMRLWVIGLSGRRSDGSRSVREMGRHSHVEHRRTLALEDCNKGGEHGSGPIEQNRCSAPSVALQQLGPVVELDSETGRFTLGCKVQKLLTAGGWQVVRLDDPQRVRPSDGERKGVSAEGLPNEE
jgi:hypothetical protein